MKPTIAKGKSMKSAHVDSLVAKRLSISMFQHEMGKLGIYVVMPGSAVTAAFLTDESRFFPTIGDSDIVVGGHFG